MTTIIQLIHTNLAIVNRHWPMKLEILAQITTYQLQNTSQPQKSFLSTLLLLNRGICFGFVEVKSQDKQNFVEK